MFRNYLAAALRNLVRNKLYAGINIVGLAVGFAAAIFAGLFVRNELTYDRWIPGHDQIYGIATTYALQRGVFGAQEHNGGHRDAAAWLKTDFTEVEAATRYLTQGQIVVHHGDVRAVETAVSSADVDFFSVVQFPALAGDLRAALDQPDGIVLTRSFARKYFGRDIPMGETIELDQHPMRVTAVIEDLPSNTTFTEQAFISERASFSSLKRLDALRPGPDTDPGLIMDVKTLFRIKAGASIGPLQEAVPGFVGQHMPEGFFGKVKMRFFPLAALHLFPFNYAAAAVDRVRERAQLLAAIYGVAGIGVLILLAAVTNFVNATTARASRRAVEVGIRKVTGAARRQLIVQFMGESVIYTLLGMIAAIGLVVILLPRFQALLDRTVAFQPWRDTVLAAGIAGVALAAGMLAGVYPALILSSLRPATVLKTGIFNVGGSGAVRQGLVTLQFAILISVAVIAGVVYNQTDFAMNENLRFDKDQVLTITGGCRAAIKAEVQALPGVRTAACGPIGYNSRASAPDGTPLGEWTEIIDYGTFDVLGLKPVAGRFFAPDRGEDAASPDPSTNPNVVINETAVRKLGFASPAAAIGQTISWRRVQGNQSVDGMPLVPSRIIGVVADISGLYETVLTTYIPRMYYIDINSPLDRGLMVKLTGRDIPETLRSIDRIWDRLGDPRVPIQRRFINQLIEAIYRDLIQQERVIAAFTGVALFIAALGLFGLSAFTAERRKKEIGIRKAMGANRADILRLLLWEFSKPVLAANVIAWPVGYFVMRRWLEGFAYHVDLSPWIFLAVSALALLIAVLTVAGHALLVARAQPATALRYE